VILHVMSDLHLDLVSSEVRAGFFKTLRARYYEAPEPQALVLAGDIGSLAKQKSGILTDSLHEFCEIYPEVIFVAGNHEYWGTSIPEGQKVLKKIEKKLPGLVVLRVGKSLQHKNNRISGDTLWFPECGDAYLKRGWCDFTQIGGSRGGEIGRAHV